MRIISGTYKGRALLAPKGMVTRPTTQRVRESLFNILAHREDFSLTGARVIDLFAGSGALGLEAISRGASFCLFVENASAARACIRRNIENLGMFGQTRLQRRSATNLGLLPNDVGGAFDIAFLDAPYKQGLLTPAIESLLSGGWLKEEAMIVTEQGKSEPEDIYPQGYSHLEASSVDYRLFGAARIQIVKIIPKTG